MARRPACASRTAPGAPSCRPARVRTRPALLTCLTQNAPANSRLYHPAHMRRTHATVHSQGVHGRKQLVHAGDVVQHQRRPGRPGCLHHRQRLHWHGDAPVHQRWPVGCRPRPVHGGRAAVLAGDRLPGPHQLAVHHGRRHGVRHLRHRLHHLHQRPAHAPVHQLERLERHRCQRLHRRCVLELKYERSGRGRG